MDLLLRSWIQIPENPSYGVRLLRSRHQNHAAVHVWSAVLPEAYKQLECETWTLCLVRGPEKAKSKKHGMCLLCWGYRKQ